jgi:para-nitrobenzyl esterase
MRGRPAKVRKSEVRAKLESRCSRRDLLKYSLIAGTSLTATGVLARLAEAAEVEASSGGAIVETCSGKVRGVYTGEVNIFKGIPYGAATGGRNRFLPPQKPNPWSGVRAVLDYGPMAMQTMLTPEELAALMSPSALAELNQVYAGLGRTPPGPESEDCLVLNVWTPEVKGNDKRPVLVWLHGGGFSGGSGDWGWTDGTNLARKNDVVVVSLNHRLNIFGYLYLGELDDARYADSGNAGMLDIVAALEWVRDNIHAFGGDPGNVTVFGQSGGGCKVNVLMAMPAARGLFHKAIQMSGPGPKMLTREQAALATTRVLDELGITPAKIKKLQTVPAKQLLKAAKSVLSAANLAPDETWRGGTWFHMFDPVVDGRSLPQHPFDPVAPAVSAHVPMLIGNCADESRIDAGLRAPLTFSVDTLDERGLRANLKGMGIGEARAAQLIAAYRASRPEATTADVFSAIATDLEYRRDAITIAERKSALGKAPAFMYLFTWASPAFGGKYKSAHGFEQPFVFDNVDRAPGLWGATPDPRRYELAEKMSQIWVTFARNGAPSHPELPPWRRYTATDRGTMELNYACAWVNDPRREERLVAQLK